MLFVSLAGPGKLLKLFDFQKFPHFGFVSPFRSLFTVLERYFGKSKASRGGRLGVERGKTFAINCIEMFILFHHTKGAHTQKPSRSVSSKLFFLPLLAMNNINESNQT
jgi:hypothetical protein